MSELESLAAEIRALGDESGRELRLAQSMAARYASLGQRLAGMGHLRGIDGLAKAYDALAIAHRRSEEATAQLEALREGANGFADNLVGSGAGSAAGGGDLSRTGLLGALAGLVTEAVHSIVGTAVGADVERDPPVSVLSKAEIEHLMPSINPGGSNPFDPGDAYRVNCGNVAANLFDALNGGPAVAAGVGTLSIEAMNQRTGRTQRPMTPSQIEAALRAAGPGAHAVVGIDRRGGDGHWFNVYFDGDQVWTLDAQPYPVRVDGFPPSDETEVVLWDLSL